MCVTCNASSGKSQAALLHGRSTVQLGSQAEAVKCSTYICKAGNGECDGGGGDDDGGVTGKLWSPRSFTCEMQLSSSHLNWKRASTAIWGATCAPASVTGTNTTRRCIAVLLTPLPPREQQKGRKCNANDSEIYCQLCPSQ